MIKTAVARRYAKALLSLVDRSAVAQTREALLALGQAVRSSPALVHAMASPAFSAEEKSTALTAIAARLKSPPILGRFLSQLVAGNRVPCLPDIAEAFAALADEQEGRRQVTVTAPRTPSADEQKQIQKRLRELLHQDIDLTFHHDPALLSGLQVRIGSTVYDSTVRSRLAALRAALTKE